MAFPLAVGDNSTLKAATLRAAAVVATLWVGHHSHRLSLALVMVIMIDVYPLRAMSAGALSTITGGWLPSSVGIHSADQLRPLFAIYGTGFVAGNLRIVALYAHALNCRDDVGLFKSEVFLTRGEIVAWLIMGFTGLLSAVSARTARAVAFASWSDFLRPILISAWGYWLGRRFHRAFGPRD